MNPRRNDDMVCQDARVVKYEDGVASVIIDQGEHCEGCHAKGHCGVMMAGDKPVEVKYPDKLEIGQRVEIGLMPGAILKASILLFILPALAFAVGIAIGYWLADFITWADKQWVGFITGIILTAITYWVIKIVTPALEKKDNYEPIITRLLN